MFDKIEWSEERRREERAGTQMVGMLVIFMAALCVGLIIAWPAKVASILLLLCGAACALGSLADKEADWGERAALGVLGAGLVYLGVRAVLWAFLGVW
jgi:hypothetical protein